MTNILEEQDTYRRIAVSASQLGLNQIGSPLEASLRLAEGKIDRSFISCPATPMLYPFFGVVDEWIYHLIAAPEGEAWIRRNVDILKNFLSQRDQLWVCLQQCTYDRTLASSFLGFDERGFVVQWIWLKKRMSTLLSGLPSAGIQHPLVNKLTQHMEILVDAIDQVLFDTTNGLLQSTDILWKKGGHPLVPRQSSQWQALALLSQTSHKCALWQQRAGDSTIKLQDLIESNSPVLFLEPSKKGDLLAASCMCFLTATDEVNFEGGVRSSYENEQLCISLSEELERRKQAFAIQVRSSMVDVEITTVENMLDLESLSKLKELDGHREDVGQNEDFLHSLLLRFAQVQVSPLAEFWF
ncbi:MAG: hypothetical protein AAF517_13555, partial [Planctomycetota bacterium]